MGAFALRRLGDRLLSPTAGVVGAGFLAFVVVFPTASGARTADQLKVGKECNVQPLTRGGIRVASPCRRRTLAKAVMPERRLISGKAGARLAVELFCRTPSADVSEFERRAPACLPHPSPSQRLIDANGVEAAEWPDGGFAPAPDTAMIEAYTVARLPDG